MAPFGGVVDPFRPVVEPEPFPDIASLNAARATHYQAVKRVFTESEVFVFTLGLTEGWVDKRDGSVYPLCPGTAAGEWSAERYEFRNFSHAEIMADFHRFVELVRSVNPAIRILLTVSPVALKMTASDNHVLVANTHSKATLRSVAAEVSAGEPLIDYFPSFEIISAHPMKAMFFEPDMREVNPAGVRFVMSHFSSQHPAAGKKGKAAPRTEAEPIDIVCEEMLLEQLAG